jgi:MerR family transcriptional regulator, redox-sensitive transcriptional activator SoxR
VKSALELAMPLLTISEVAARVGLRASAIRYYEQVGILPAAQRISGQRRYDEAALCRLAALQRARQIGFTLKEIRQLFFGFRNGTAPSERWKKLSQRKLAELKQMMNGIRAMQLILRGQGKCGCASLEECGKALLRGRFGKVTATFSPENYRPGRQKFVRSSGI